MLYEAQTCHLGSDMSCVEILTVLYFDTLRRNDHFIMSKGHGAAALYATLAEKGAFEKEKLATYGQDGTEFLNLVSKEVPGVEFSTGSLGHGLPVAVGLAVAEKQNESPGNIYTLLSDGELQCGTTWESAMFASHNKLNNLYIIIDYNRLQACGWINDVVKVEPIDKKFEAFGCTVREVDGHNTKELIKALNEPSDKPVVIISHTIKGKGIPFAENNNAWHYNNLTEALYTRALEALE